MTAPLRRMLLMWMRVQIARNTRMVIESKALDDHGEEWEDIDDEDAAD